MSKDIVKRLRDTEAAAQFATPIQVEAADEIERLLKENERMRLRMKHVDELLEVIDRPVPSDVLGSNYNERSWRYDIHVARSRVNDLEI